MLSKEEHNRIRDEIVAFLRECQRYLKQDLLNKYTGYDSRTIELLIWEARECVRLEDGIDFGPLRGWPGHFERKDWNQIEHRAQRQRRRGTRAHKRAEERLRLAAGLAPDQSKERLNEAADRLALRIAMKASKS